MCYAEDILYVGLFTTDFSGGYAFFDTYSYDGGWTQVTNLTIAEINMHNIFFPKFNKVLHKIDSQTTLGNNIDDFSGWEAITQVYFNRSTPSPLWLLL